MKRMTLDELWENCIKMAESVARSAKRRGLKNIPLLKRSDFVEAKKEAWLKRNNIKKVTHDCLFCHYARCVFVEGCACRSRCPARKIDSGFFCNNTRYHYAHRPVAFHKKLVSLNRKRLKAKK